MNRLLVTGACGFIGRHILELLDQSIYQIHATYHTSAPVTHIKGINWHKINLNHWDEIDSLLKNIKASHILHLAWFAKPREYLQSLYNITCLQSSLHIFEKFIEYGGKRAVCIGSCYEYGLQYHVCKEDATPCLPNTLYGKAKLYLNGLSSELFKSKDVSFAWARIFYLFGEYEHRKRLVPDAINHFVANKKFHIITHDHIKDYMYAGDVASALVALLNSKLIGTVNIGSGDETRIGDLIMKISSKLTKKNLIVIDNQKNIVPNNNQYLIADISRLKNELKWQPDYTLDEGLERTISWWKKNG
jgi:nucleoside-diphosphate-sugar epimerase